MPPNRRPQIEAAPKPSRPIAALPRSFLGCALALLLPLSTAASAADCVKLVFNAVCLGGPADTLPPGSRAPANGNGSVTLAAGESPVRVEVRERLIVAVQREEPPGSWLNYLDWRNKLIRIYGIGEDLSEFPPSANSRSSRQNAINLGIGRAHTNWEQDGWRVAVIWDNREHVTLRYELHEARPAAVPDTEGL